MSERAVRRCRRHRNVLARRCEKCRSGARHHASVLQESPVQLRIFEFAKMTIAQRSRAQRLGNCVKMTCARTLSRTVWQQKNFRGHSAQASPTRAKPNFSDESRSAIRMHACRRDGRLRCRNGRSMRPCAPRSRHHRRHNSPCWSMISAQTRSADVARENRLPLFRIMLRRVPLRDDFRCRASPSGDR